MLGLLIGCRPQSGAHPSAPRHTTRRDAIVAYRWLPALVSQHARQGSVTPVVVILGLLPSDKAKGTRTRTRIKLVTWAFLAFLRRRRN